MSVSWPVFELGVWNSHGVGGYQSSVEFLRSKTGEGDGRVVDEDGIAVADRLGRPAVNLEGDAALALAFGIAQSGAECPVDGRPDAIVDGQDFIAIPVAGFDGIDSAVVPVELAAAVFVVELTPNLLSNVSLIAVRLPVVVHLPGAELDSGIAVGRREFDIDREIEVLHGQIGPKKFVIGHRFVRVADDGAVLDRPEAVVSTPPGEVFPIEKGFPVEHGLFRERSLSRGVVGDEFQGGVITVAHFREDSFVEFFDNGLMLRMADEVGGFFGVLQNNQVAQLKKLFGWTFITLMSVCREAAIDFRFLIPLYRLLGIHSLMFFA